MCFLGLAVDNLLLVTDKIVLINIDLQWPRTVVLFISAVALLAGLILESR